MSTNIGLHPERNRDRLASLFLLNTPAIPFVTDRYNRWKGTLCNLKTDVIVMKGTA
jgi:hypothetical protein